MENQAKLKLVTKIRQLVDSSQSTNSYKQAAIVLRREKACVVDYHDLLPGDLFVLRFWPNHADIIKAVTIKRAVTVLWPVLQKLIL